VGLVSLVRPWAKPAWGAASSVSPQPGAAPSPNGCASALAVHSAANGIRPQAPAPATSPKNRSPLPSAAPAPEPPFLRHLGVIKRVLGTYRYYLTRAGRAAIAAGRRLTEHTIIPALA
jgi:hypothetical protein